MLERRPKQLHIVNAELHGDVVAGAGFAMAGSETVELGTNVWTLRIGGHRGGE